MEGSPDEIDVEALLNDIKQIQDGIKIHDFHLWSISMGKFALSAHVTCKNDPMFVLKEVTKTCKEKHNIDHVTI